MNIEKCFNMLRKSGVHGINKKDRGMKGMQAAMNKIYTRAPEIISTMEPSFHADEYYWATKSKKVYFPASEELVKNLIAGSFNIQDPVALMGGESESFILMLPKGMEIGGRKVGSGLLVTMMPIKQRAESMFPELFQWIGIPTPEIVVPGGLVTDFSIAINYQEDIDTIGYSRLIMPSSDFSTVIAMKSADEFIEYYEKTNQCPNLDGYMPLDREGYVYQFELFKLVCGFLVYRRCMADRFTEGLPAEFNKFESTSACMPEYKAAVFTGPDGYSHGPKSAHYRSWHFRQLMDERYYKGVHAAEKPGSRVVFVRDSYVGAEVEPETVT